MRRAAERRAPADHRERLAADAARREQLRAARAGGVSADELRRDGASRRELARPDVDQRAGEVALLIGCEGLGRRDGLQQSRWEQIERYDALLWLRARDARAVERRGRIALAESAHEHVASVLHRDSADALHSLRCVAVRDSC